MTAPSALTQPFLSWAPNPVATLASPATLSTNQLTAVAKVSSTSSTSLAGTWSYAPAAGASLPVGTNQIVGTFVPDDLNTYSVATITNRVIVTDPDTDGDGFTDGEEIAAGTSASSASSFPTNGVTGRVFAWGLVDQRRGYSDSSLLAKRGGSGGRVSE